MENIVCRRCNVEKPLSDFPPKRRKCRDCLNEMARERRALKKKNPKPEPIEKVNPNSFKTCLNCTKVKNIMDFSKGRNHCKKCMNEKLRQSKEKKKAEQDPNETKLCKKCNQSKKVSDFSIGRSKCKKCENEARKIRKAKRIEKEKDLKTKTCRKCNIEQDKSKFRDGEFTCWDCQKEILYKWRKDNPDKISAIDKKKRSKIGYQDKANKHKRDRYNNDIQEKLRMNYRQKLRNFIFKGWNKKDYSEMFGCKREFFLHWLEYNFNKNMNWNNYGSIWQLDHIKPCSSYDLTNDEELLECFSWKNTMPIMKKDNLKKFVNIDNLLIEKFKIMSKIFEKKYQQKYQHIKPTLLKILQKKETI